jgi:hypothetical protein
MRDLTTLPGEFKIAQDSGSHGTGALSEAGPSTDPSALGRDGDRCRCLFELGIAFAELLPKCLSINQVTEGQADRPKRFGEQLIDDPIVIGVQERSIDKMTDQLIVNEYTEVKTSIARFAGAVDVLPGAFAFDPRADQFLVLEVELSKLLPPGIVVEPDVRYHETLIIWMIRVLLNDDAHHSTDKLDEWG